jgi:hypothetical protein
MAANAGDMGLRDLKRLLDLAADIVAASGQQACELRAARAETERLREGIERVAGGNVRNLNTMQALKNLLDPL